MIRYVLAILVLTTGIALAQSSIATLRGETNEPARMTSAADAKNSAIDLPIFIPRDGQKQRRSQQQGTFTDRLLVSENRTSNKTCMLNTPLTRYCVSLRLLCNFATSGGPCRAGITPRRAG